MDRGLKPKFVSRKDAPFALLALLGLALFFLLGFAGSFWPPRWLEHNRQHREVLKRINQIPGGWNALKQEAESLATQNEKTGFLWMSGSSFLVGGGHTNYALPPALAALKPKEMEFQPHGVFHGEEAEVEVLRIKIFGMHSTGPGYSTPYFGLEVVWGPGTNIYQPPNKEAASGNGHKSFRKLADNIYEIY